MTVGNQASTQANTGARRLSRTVLPELYELRIEPDLANASFQGDETIKVKIASPVNSIVLNTAEIIIEHATLRPASAALQDSILNATISCDEDAQITTLSWSKPADSGEWLLELKFRGILNDKLRGFYRSSYKDSEGKEHLIATTKFEPSDARRAFPCFDEPDFKASFQVSLLIDADLTAIANTAIVSEDAVAGGKKLIKFAPSIKMSSYLVAYMVGPFVSSEAVDSNGIPIRVWTVPGKQDLTHYALRAAKYSLDYFAEYFKQAYPGDKLDLIAIPDFASGAMENFGAITFRETALLLDESRATIAELKRVAEVICHENAHMWFGDLVTMSWWNGLWLNEAFATFMAAKVLDQMMPSWKFWEGFNIEKAGAMRIDGLNASRSIEFPVSTPEDARAMFDVLTYEKGCAILRMLELYIGEDVFRKGCQIYMAKHAFANTETADLWNALQTAVNEAGLNIPVAEMMDTWVFQQGFPLVTASRSGNKLQVRQQAFRYLNEQGKKNQLWYVPLAVRGSVSSDEKCFVLSEAEQSFPLSDEAGLLVLNANGKGFYRVAYSDELLQYLLANLQLLSPPERFNLISDLWAATLSGEMSSTAYLQNLRLIVSQETDVNVFSVILGSIAYLRRVVACSLMDQQNSFITFCAELLVPVLDKIGWDKEQGELEQNAELRTALISLLGTMPVPSVLTEAKELWNAFLEKPESLDPNLLPCVVECMSAQGDLELYQKFLRLKDNAATPQEENRFLFALAGFRKEELIKRTLNRTLDGSIRIQDAPMMIRALFYNPAAGKLSWEFVKENWNEIEKKFPLQGVIRLCDGLTVLMDPVLEGDIHKFAQNLRVKGNEKALAQNLETLSIANRFLEREHLAMSKLLSKY